MEIGNLLFGHSRGRYPVDREIREARELWRMLHVLGFSEYGRNVFSEIKPPDSLRIEETRRGATISDEHGLLMETRAYWWGDTETEEDRKQAELHSEGSRSGTPARYRNHRMGI